MNCLDGYLGIVPRTCVFDDTQLNIPNHVLVCNIYDYVCTYLHTRLGCWDLIWCPEGVTQRGDGSSFPWKDILVFESTSITSKGYFKTYPSGSIMNEMGSDDLLRTGETSSSRRSSRDTSRSSSSSSRSLQKNRSYLHLTKRVGKYLVGRTIGEGTYAKVKYAQHSETGKAYALKVLSKEFLIQRGMVDQVKKEISILKKVKHPYIVNLHEIMSSKDKIFLVMELVTGGDLFDTIAIQGPFKEEDGKVMFSQIVAAVAYCHKNGVCHRDLKPENVLLTSEGQAKLSDFGLGAIRDDEASYDLMNTVCGTPNYAAPEVISKKPYSGYAADVWSLGVVLYVILAGCLPFDEDNMVHLFEKVAHGEYTMPAWISDEAKELLQSMLQVDASRRPTAEQLLQCPWIKDVAVCSSPVVDDSASISGEEMCDFEPVSPRELKTRLQGLMDHGPKDDEKEWNAFELINDFFDISAIFEEKDDLITRHTQFTTYAPTEYVFDEIENATVAVGSGRVVKRSKDQLRLYVKSLKGIIHAKILVIRLKHGGAIVDVQKASGNTNEFYKWYSEMVSILPGDVIQPHRKGMSETTRGPTKMNAFELISRNVCLSPIFEDEEESTKGHIQFSTTANIKDVLVRIKQGATALGGVVENFDLDLGSMDLIVPTTSRRGMAVSIKHIEVLPSMYVVQMTKKLGSMLDLCKFYNKLTAAYLNEYMMKKEDGRIPHPQSAAIQSLLPTEMKNTQLT